MSVSVRCESRVGSLYHDWSLNKSIRSEGARSDIHTKSGTLTHFTHLVCDSLYLEEEGQSHYVSGTNRGGKAYALHKLEALRMVIGQSYIASGRHASLQLRGI